MGQKVVVCVGGKKIKPIYREGATEGRATLFGGSSKTQTKTEREREREREREWPRYRINETGVGSHLPAIVVAQSKKNTLVLCAFVTYSHLLLSNKQFSFLWFLAEKICFVAPLYNVLAKLESNLSGKTFPANFRLPSSA